MKIGRLIERNVFTDIWLLAFMLLLLGKLLGCDYFAHSSWQQFGWLICYCAGVYSGWPCIFFVSKEGYDLFGPPWQEILSMMISLSTCITVDFLLRKILWNKKRVS